MALVQTSDYMTCHNDILRSRRMRHRVLLQSPATVSDGQGGVTTTWQNIATVWAEVKEKTASEYSQANKLTGSVVYEITVRHRADILTATRIVYDSRNLNVTGVTDPTGVKRYLKLNCKDGVAT